MATNKNKDVYKTLRHTDIKPSLMTFSRRQPGKKWKRTYDGSLAPLCEGEVEFVRDLRTRADGFLGGTPVPEKVGSFRRDYIGVDTRDGVRYIFTVDDTALWLEGRIDTDGNYTSIGIRIAVCPAEPVETCQAGSFFVVLLADGSLHYLLWEWDEQSYTYVGAAPAMPEFSLSPYASGAVSATVAAVDFREPVSDFRQGVPAEVEHKVGGAFLDAWRECESSARASRRFVSPPAVKVAMRMWDGSLYDISPLTVPQLAFPVSQRLRANPVSGSGGAVGTEQTSVSLDSYELKITFRQSLPDVWKQLVRSFDVFVGSPEGVLAETSPSVTYSRETGALFVSLRVRDENTLREELESLPLRLAASIPVSDAESVVRVPSSGEILESGQEKITAGADTISGHDAFLHTGKGDSLCTMLYGNPFVPVSVTSVGAKIHFIRAQAHGGGAFTRQYLYLFTSAGIIALLHDKEGRHTNCRSVSTRIVTSPRRIAVSDNRMYALSDDGILLCIADSKVSEIMSGISGASSLGWDAANRELWISPGSSYPDGWRSSMVLAGLPDSLCGYVRTSAPAWILPGNPLVMLTSEALRTGYDIMMPDPVSASGTILSAHSRWVGLLPEMPGGAMIGRYTFEMADEETDARGIVRYKSHSRNGDPELASFESGMILVSRSCRHPRYPWIRTEVAVNLPYRPILSSYGSFLAEARGSIPVLRFVSVCFKSRTSGK